MTLVVGGSEWGAQYLLTKEDVKDSRVYVV
ncbi:hypothetical protein A5806_002545 [Enterococcus faecium]|nr:hypothetical protein A5806_002545 [Enterococcus faecium]